MNSIAKFFIAVSIVLFLSLILTASINFGTVIHESSHTITAWLLGCPAGFGTQVYVGATQFECNPYTNIVGIIIAFAGPLMAFLVGLFIWTFLDKDNPLRLFGATLFFFSAIPSLFPLLEASDAQYIITAGFPLWLMWVIYAFTSGIFAYLLIEEITERRLTYW